MNARTVKTGFGHSQRGVALIMSLVMLLILTILGVSSVQNTSLQERMSRNARDTNLAFQGAETAIREAEVYLGTVTSLLPFQNSNVNGYYDATDDGDGPVDFSQFTWIADPDAPDVSTDCDPGAGFEDRDCNIVDTNIDGVSAQPRYVIEFIKTVVSDEDRLNIDNIGQDTGSGRTQIFRVTAYGTGGTSTAHVMIQTTYGKRF